MYTSANLCDCRSAPVGRQFLEQDQLDRTPNDRVRNPKLPSTQFAGTPTVTQRWFGRPNLSGSGGPISGQQNQSTDRCRRSNLLMRAGNIGQRETTGDDRRHLTPADHDQGVA